MRFERLHKYPFEVNTKDIIKVLATISMICDHIGFYFYPPHTSPVLRILGDYAAPCFFYLSGLHFVEHPRGRYVFYGLAITLITFITRDYLYMDILVVFFVIHLVLMLLQKRPSAALAVSIVVACLLLNVSLRWYVEFGGLGICYGIAASYKRIPRRRALMYVLTFTTIAYQYIMTAYFYPKGHHVIVWGATTAYHVHFILYQLVYAGILLSLVPLRIKTLRVPAILKAPIIILSRFSLEIYVVHYVMCKLISAYLGIVGDFAAIQQWLRLS